MKKKGKYYEILFLKLGETHKIPIKDVKIFDISKTGDRYPKKVCDRCFKFLDTKMFSGNRLKKGNVITNRPSCKDCRKLKDGKKIPAEMRKGWDQKGPKKYSLFQKK